MRDGEIINFGNSFSKERFRKALRSSLGGMKPYFERDVKSYFCR